MTLIEFLISENALDQFLFNFHERCKDDQRLLDNRMERLKSNKVDIDGVFHWADTPEGVDFWSHLNDKYREIKRDSN